MKKISGGIHTVLARLTTCAALGAIAVSGYALTTTMPAMSLEQMTKEADEIVVGNVVNTRAKIVEGHIETDYNIQIHDNLKARTGNLPPGKTFTFTVAGGALEEPPLTQYAMSAPYLFTGEEVFLFLKEPSGKKSNLPVTRGTNVEKSTLGSSYKLVGWSQGRFSVVTRKTDGKRFVTQVNLENFGLTNDTAGMRELKKGLEQEQIPTINQPVIRSQDYANTSRTKDPLEFTTSDGRKMKVEQKAQQTAITQALYQRKITVEDYDQFKNSVQTIVSTGN